jgi:CBS-domain-containing membrane protein
MKYPPSIAVAFSIILAQPAIGAGGERLAPVPAITRPRLLLVAEEVT